MEIFYIIVKLFLKKAHLLNILGFDGNTVYVTQLYHYCKKVAINKGKQWALHH